MSLKLCQKGVGGIYMKNWVAKLGFGLLAGLFIANLFIFSPIGTVYAAEATATESKHQVSDDRAKDEHSAHH